MINETDNMKKELELLQDTFVDKKRVQELWSCSGQTVERAAKDGVITKHRIPGQTLVRYRLSEVMNAMKAKQS